METSPYFAQVILPAVRDPFFEVDRVKKMDEIHFYEQLLVVISNIFGRKTLCLRFLSLEDEKISHVFEWERSILFLILSDLYSNKMPHLPIWQTAASLIFLSI